MNPDLERTQIKLHKALRGFLQSDPYAFVDALDGSRTLALTVDDIPFKASDVVGIKYLWDNHEPRHANFRLGELLMLGRLARDAPPPPHRKRRRPNTSGEPGPHARGGDPATSHEAASQLSPRRLSAIRTMILRTYWIEGEDGLTDIDLVRRCDGDQRRSTIRTRRSELERDYGYVEDSGRVKFQEGSNRIIWQLTEAGKAEAKRLWG